VHPSDLRVSSRIWMSAAAYWPVRPDVFAEALSTQKIPYANILGLEFSSDLHSRAQVNIERYRGSTQRIASLCVDFTTFQLPISSLVLYFYNPASHDVMTAVAMNISRSLRENPRPIFVIYGTPTYDIFENGKPLALRKTASSGDKFAIYGNAA
jgi:hypothetical protein